MTVDRAGFQRTAEIWAERLAAPAESSRALGEVRRLARDRFLRTGLPWGRLDAWRYADLRDWNGAEFESPRPEPLADAELKALSDGFLIAADERRIVVVNGHVVPGPACAGRGEALEFRPLGPSLGGGETGDAAGGPAERETAPLWDLNTLAFRDGALLRVPRGVKSDKLLHVLVVSGSERAAVSSPRLVVSIEAGASARLAVTFAGRGAAPHFCNAACDVRLGEGARLEWTVLSEGRAGLALSLTTEAALAAGAHLERLTFVSGGGTALDETRVRLGGAGASAHLRGLSILTEDARSHLRALVEHAAPGCRSRQTCKSILAGRSRSEFDSRVEVRRGAAGADSQQQGRSLLLSAEAAAHARPVLRIDTDDVACSHGAAVGQLDPEELFYLRSRGLSEADARFVLLEGFADDVFEGVGDPPLRARLESLARRKLAALAAPGDMPC